MGNAEERNYARALEADRDHRTEDRETADDGVGSRTRSELARELIRRVDDLLPQVGEVSLATSLQHLKRDLSRCHAALKNHPGEGDFLSIVTLVESAMAPLKWKQYTRPQLEAIRQAFDLGYRQPRVGFEDYQKARSLFAAKQVDATPRVDLEKLKWEDITDDEEP